MRHYTEFKYQNHFFESERLINNLIIKIFPEFLWKYYKYNDSILLDNEFLDISNFGFTEITEEEYKLEKSHKYQTLNYELQDEIMQTKDFSITVDSYMEYLYADFRHYIDEVYKETESRNKDYLFKNIFKAIEESTDYYKNLLDNSNINRLQRIIIENLIFQNKRKPDLIKNDFSDLVSYVTNYFPKQSSIPFLSSISIKEQYLSVFSSEHAQKWFMDILETMNISPAKNGFNAKLNAIYSNKDCKAEIFRYELSLKDYIGFINSIFPNSIKNNTKMSDASRHELKVNELINIYLQDKSE